MKESFLEPSYGLVFYGLLSCIISFAIAYIFKRRQRAWILDKIPGAKSNPIFGHALDLNVEPKELFKVMNGKFCDFETSISRIWIGWEPFCLIHKASGVEALLSSQKHIEKSSVYRFLHPWLGFGLLTSSGKKWHSRRKLLTPAFHFKILEDFIEVFNQQSNIFVDKLAPKANGKAFDIFPLITLCTLDIILESAMGISIHAQNDSESAYIKALYKCGEIVQLRQTRPWLKSDIMFNCTKLKTEYDACIKTLHALSNQTIQKKRKIFKKFKMNDEDVAVLGKKKRLAFLDLLLNYIENGQALSDEDIREEVDTFIFEGHDTTAAAINWAIYCIGSHPEIQEKLYEEIKSVLGESDRQVTSSDLKEMKYLDCCVKEALRVFPSVPFFGRELQEDMIIDGYRIPTGTECIVLSYRLHRDPNQFPNPEEYLPERFLLQNKRHPYAYVPFSAGPRNCIGQKFAQMEDKIVVVNFLRRYRVESVVKKEDLKILGELILRPEDGSIVKLYPRN